MGFAAEVVMWLAAGAAIASLAWALAWRLWLRRTDQERRKLAQWAKKDAEYAAKEILEKADREIGRRGRELEEALGKRELQCRIKENEIKTAEEARHAEAETQKMTALELEKMRDEVSRRSAAVRKVVQRYRQRAQKKAGMTMQKAREIILEEARRECEDEARQLKRRLLRQSEREVEAEARRILMDAMQRLSSVPHHDITATIVPIPSEDMKGRIIGREGRNIKAFELASGTALLIDETPDSILVSSFDPVRREMARLALERLMKDGRIHPGSIEEAVAAAGKEVERRVAELGEDALRRGGINRAHPGLVSRLGQLHFRLSNNQNTLDHSIEVANLCGLLADELGLDKEKARRAGFFHDLGKALDEEHEGGHAAAGAEFLKRHGEDPEVINAVAAHHGGVPAASVYAVLLSIADSLSATRPGARAESTESYFQRVRNLEALAASFEGVADAYALQAGREIRVVVNPEKMKAEDARLLAVNLRRRIEEDLQYPGTIKITVIREQRFLESAT